MYPPHDCGGPSADAWRPCSWAIGNGGACAATACMDTNGSCPVHRGARLRRIDCIGPAPAICNNAGRKAGCSVAPYRRRKMHRVGGLDRKGARAKTRGHLGWDVTLRQMQGRLRPQTAKCTNTCPYAHNGVCDDGSLLLFEYRPRVQILCDIATDCADCNASRGLVEAVGSPVAQLRALGVTVHARWTLTRPPFIMPCA